MDGPNDKFQTVPNSSCCQLVSHQISLKSDGVRFSTFFAYLCTCILVKNRPPSELNEIWCETNWQQDEFGTVRILSFGPLVAEKYIFQTRRRGTEPGAGLCKSGLRSNPVAYRASPHGTTLGPSCTPHKLSRKL